MTKRDGIGLEENGSGKRRSSDKLELQNITFISQYFCVTFESSTYIQSFLTIYILILIITLIWFHFASHVISYKSISLHTEELFIKNQWQMLSNEPGRFLKRIFQHESAEVKYILLRQISVFASAPIKIRHRTFLSLVK